MLVGIGIWYWGSSITKGAGLPANALVFLSIKPDIITDKIPMKYDAVAISGLPPKSAPAINATIGILAPQGMKHVVIMVILRSRSSSIVRLAITPGTPQPVATKRGIKLLPERPNFLKIRSIIKAIRDIYPQSSKIASKKKRISICGTKPNTAPTPPIIPLVISSINHSAQFIDASHAAANSDKRSKTVSVKPIVQLPTEPIEI